MNILKVKYWTTINDPYTMAGRGYGNGDMAPGMNHPEELPYRVAHNLINAHVRVYRMYEKDFKDTQRGNLSTLIRHLQKLHF